MNAIEFKDVDFAYDSKWVLKNFGCQVEQGTLLSLQGPSGSGKTSFLRLCAGLERPQAGTILLRDKVVAGSNVWVEPGDRSVGFVFQNLALFEKVSVKKNIEYACRNKEQKQEAHRLAERLGIDTYLHKKPFELSGGERQRVALARSLAVKPDILFLDEPFASMDSKLSLCLIDEFREMFIELRITALMVTHSSDEARCFSREVMTF